MSVQAAEKKMLRRIAAVPSAICWFIAAMLVLSVVMDLIYGRPVAYTRAISPSIWAFYGGYFWLIRRSCFSENPPDGDQIGGFFFGFIGSLVLLIGVFVTYYSLPGLAIVAIGLGIIGGSVVMSRSGVRKAPDGKRWAVVEDYKVKSQRKTKYMLVDEDATDSDVRKAYETSELNAYTRVREDWAKGRILSESENEGRDGTWFWVAVVAWSLWAIASVAILVFGGDPVAILVLAAMAAIFSASEIYRFVHRMKFTRSCLILDPMPPELRETVTMTVETGLRASKWRPTECSLTFDCVKVTSKLERDDDGGTSATTTTDVLWSAKTTAMAEQRDGIAGLVLSSQFEIPSDQPPSTATTSGAQTGNHWRLYVHADLPGLDYRARYVLPVTAAGHRRQLSGDASDVEAERPWGTGSG